MSGYTKWRTTKHSQSRVHQLGHLGRTELIARWLALATECRTATTFAPIASRERLVDAIITLERKAALDAYQEISNEIYYATEGK